MTGDKSDVKRITRQLLNRGSASRTIPKQECMVELADLPLVVCTEMTETVNLSGSYKIKSTTHADLVNRYRRIASSNPTLSLHQFVSEELVKKGRRKHGGRLIIPHYVGANGQPKYPPTKEYAMATLIVHKPWKASKPPKLSDEEWIDQFKMFIQTDECPLAVKIEYARVKERTIRRRNAEPVATDECYDNEDNHEMDAETRDIINIVTHLTRPTDPFFTVDDVQFDKGLNYNWGSRCYPVSDFVPPWIRAEHLKCLNKNRKKDD